MRWPPHSPRGDDLLPDRGNDRPEPRWRTALLVTGLIVLATGVGGAGLVLARPGTVVTASPSATVTTPALVPTDSASRVPPEEPSATPHRTIAASGLATIPDDLTLPHERDRRWHGTNLTVDDCAEEVPRRPESLREASDVRTVQMSSSLTESRSESLVVAADENTAARVIADITHLLTTCPSPADELPAATYITGTIAAPPTDKRSPAGDWTQTTLIVNTFPQQDGPTRAQYVLLAQAERAVVIAVISGQKVPAPKGDTPHAATVKTLQTFADDMAARLCRFTAHGCTPPEPDPVVLPEGSVELPDGRVLLPDGTIFTPGDAPMRLAAEATDPQPVQPTQPPAS